MAVVAIVDANRYDTHLLICDKDKSICPISDHAFTATQSSQSTLDSTYIGCRVISRNGEVREIRSITRLGLWGSGIGRKIVSALTGAYVVEVEFESFGIVHLDKLKELLIEYLSYESASSDPCLPQREPIEVVVEKIRSAESTNGIFECINMPSADGCLDVL